MSEIKDRLREARRNKGLSQAGLSKLLGVSQAAIAAIESGRNKRPTNLASIAKALDVSPYWLETGKEDKEMSNSLTISGGVINGALQNNIGGVLNNTSYTLNQNSVSKPTKEELADADKHFLKSMPLLDIDIAVRHLANPDKDRTQIQSNGDRAATFIPHSRHTVGVRMADDVEFAGIKRGDILIVEPNIPPRDKDLVLICIDNTGYLRGMVGRLSIAINGTHTIIYDGGAGVPLPDGALIAGVVVEVKRRLIPTDILLSRLNPDYNIHQSKQR